MYSVSSPDVIFPCYSLLANQMSKFSLAHLFPREQSWKTAENEWGWVIYNLKTPPFLSLSLFLSLFNLHSWSGLIISLIKGDEFFITPSLSLLVSHNNNLSPSNGAIHSACTNHPLLPTSPHLTYYISSSLFISLILPNAICSIFLLYIIHGRQIGILIFFSALFESPLPSKTYHRFFIFLTCCTPKTDFKKGYHTFLSKKKGLRFWFQQEDFAKAWQRLRRHLHLYSTLRFSKGKVCLFERLWHTTS